MKKEFFSRSYAFITILIGITTFLFLIKLFQQIFTNYGSRTYFGFEYLLLIILLGGIVTAFYINKKYRISYKQPVSKIFRAETINYLKCFLIFLFLIAYCYYGSSALFSIKFPLPLIVWYQISVLIEGGLYYLWYLYLLITPLLIIFIYPLIINVIFKRGISSHRSNQPEIVSPDYRTNEVTLSENSNERFLEKTSKRNFWIRSAFYILLATFLFTIFYKGVLFGSNRFLETNNDAFQISLPTDWPEDIPIYKGFVMHSLKADNKDKTLMADYYLESHAKQDIATFYDTQLLENNWEIIGTPTLTKISDIINARSYKKNSIILSLGSYDYTEPNTWRILLAGICPDQKENLPNITDLPQKWPEEIPIYNNSTIWSVYNYPVYSKVSFKVNSIEVSEIKDFYRTALLKNNWKLSEDKKEHNLNGPIDVLVFIRDGVKIEIEVFSDTSDKKITFYEIDFFQRLTSDTSKSLLRPTKIILPNPIRDFPLHNSSTIEQLNKSDDALELRLWGGTFFTLKEFYRSELSKMGWQETYSDDRKIIFSKDSLKLTINLLSALRNETLVKFEDDSSCVAQGINLPEGFILPEILPKDFKEFKDSSLVQIYRSDPPFWNQAIHATFKFNGDAPEEKSILKFYAEKLFDEGWKYEKPENQYHNYLYEKGEYRITLYFTYLDDNKTYSITAERINKY